jgi:Uma2 family endonuclease
MTTTNKLMTADELLHLPDDNMRHELVRGELHTMTPSGHEHGEIVVNLTLPLAQFVRTKKLGKVYGAETGFVLARDPDTVLAPDISFVSNQRLQTLTSKKGFFPGAPDLAVEIMSPSETMKKAQKKAQDWIDAGTSLVWLVNPKTATVTTFHKSAEPVVLQIGEDVDGGELLPGFTLPLSEIFGV